VSRVRLFIALFVLLIHCPLRAADPASLQIRVEEGDGLSYATGSRATRGITVQVTGESGDPVDGATVTFTLPESGPGGVFSSGSRTETLNTRADGRASVWGMRWNKQAGSVDVIITASKGQAHAGTVCSLRLTESAGGQSISNGGSSHKWLWIALAAAGAAGAGVAVGARNGSTGSSCSSTVVLPQNNCSSTLTPLGVTVIGQPTIVVSHP